MKKLLLLFGMLIGPLIGWAQVPVYQAVVFVSTPSSGACVNGSPMQIAISTGAVYTCAASVWTQLGASDTDGFPITIGSTSVEGGSTTTSVSGLTVDGVTPTVFGYVDPTSSIQTQLNGKQASLGYTAAHSGANSDITSLTGLTTPLSIAQGGIGAATASQNSIFAGPATGGTGAPSFQTAPTFSAANLTGFPTLNQNTTGTSAGLSGSQTANYFYATPNGSSGTASFRAIVTADVPTLNQNTTGTAANLTGTPALPNGTTATTQTSSDSSTKLSTTAFVQSVVSGIGAANLAASGNGGVSGVLPVANGGTGTGSTLIGLVRGNSSALTAAEISGDCTTSGSNAITCTKTSGTALGTLATASVGTGVTISGNNLNSNAVYQLSFQPGLLTSVTNTISVFSKVSKASTVDNITGSSLLLSCISNPVITMYECGTSSSCSSPTTIGSVTVSATGTATAGTISSSSITAGDWVGFAISSGTCTSLDIAANSQIHSN